MEEKVMRLQKYMALSGVCSRRKAEELIGEGVVKVNGEVVVELGTKVDVDKDRVQVGGQDIYLEENKVYIMLNKPIGYVCTSNEQYNRPSVLDLVKVNERIYSVGRLDMYSSGLLILTNDGELANKLTHPKHDIVKRYMVCIEGEITKEEIYKLSQGVDIGDYITRPCKVELIKKHENDNSVLAIRITEGKYRQVRRMLEAIDKKVLSLKRVAIGNVALGDLEEGRWVYLTEREIRNI